MLESVGIYTKTNAVEYCKDDLEKKENKQDLDKDDKELKNYYNFFENETSNKIKNTLANKHLYNVYTLNFRSQNFTRGIYFPPDFI